MHLYSAKCFAVMWGVTPQPPPVCSIHLDDATAATAQGLWIILVMISGKRHCCRVRMVLTMILVMYSFNLKDLNVNKKVASLPEVNIND